MWKIGAYTNTILCHKRANMAKKIHGDFVEPLTENCIRRQTKRMDGGKINGQIDGTILYAHTNKES